MAYYVAKYDGYIADNPNIDFERCDGEVFSFYEVNTASMTNTSNVLTVNGGQGNYPQAFIDTDKSLEFTYTSSQFTLDIFQVGSASQVKEADVGTLETKMYEVETGQKIALPFEVQTGSVKIRGMKAGETLAEGIFTVKVTAATTEAAGTTEITFNEGDVALGDTVRVSYKRRVNGAYVLSMATNSTTAKGALYAHYPVYSSGTDCTESSVKGYLHVYIPRVRATALPGFDNSYKSAATNGITFAAIDPKRADNKMWDLYYEPLDENGAIVATATEGTVAWN